DENGAADISRVLAVANTIGESMEEYKLIINKSTAPVGTIKKIHDLIQQKLLDRQINSEFDVSSNPEFLKEGCAIADFMHPDRIIIGADNERAKLLLKNLYEDLPLNKELIITMDCISAELTKYAANAM